MSKKLIEVGQLKPLSFFELDSFRGYKIDERYYVHRELGGYIVARPFPTGWMIRPLPDCDSFDWDEPREPTALELAKNLLIDFDWSIMTHARNDIEDLIAAMEREGVK